MSSISYFGIQFPDEWTSQDVQTAVVLIWKHGVTTGLELLQQQHSLSVTSDQRTALCRLYYMSGFNTPLRS